MFNRDRSSFSYIWFVLLILNYFDVAAVVVAGESSIRLARESKSKIIYYPAGEHYVDEINVDSNTVIKGDGSGITYLYVKNGIKHTGKEARMSGFTLVGSGLGTGIVLRNNFRSLLEDIQIENYKLGLSVTCQAGHRCWLNTFRDLYVYEGPQGFSKHKKGNDLKNGIELRYLSEKDGVRWKGEGSMLGNRFYGGRIATRGTPLLIDGANATEMFGTYIDISHKPLYITNRTSGLQLFGVFLDRNSRAKKQKVPIIILEDPQNSNVRVFGNHYLFDLNNILDLNGLPVNEKHLTRVPKKY